MDPKQWLNFVQLDPFARACASLGLEDDDVRAIEVEIMANPVRAPVVPGAGGLRKLRVSLPGEPVGKRGGLRVCYTHFEDAGVIALVTVYRKARKDDLTAEQKKAIKRLNEEIAEYLKKRRTGKARK